MIPTPNQPASLERRDCLGIQLGHRGRGVGEPDRSAGLEVRTPAEVRKEKAMDKKMGDKKMRHLLHLFVPHLFVILRSGRAAQTDARRIAREIQRNMRGEFTILSSYGQTGEAPARDLRDHLVGVGGEALEMRAQAR